MPVTLTIKHVPDEVANALRARAAKNHRSLQGELMAIVESVAVSHDREKSAANVQRRTAAPPMEPEHSPTSSPASEATTDSLLDELDAIVAGSHWGEAAVLTRAQSHDRALVRELDYQAQEEAAKYQR